MIIFSWSVSFVIILACLFGAMWLALFLLKNGAGIAQALIDFMVVNEDRNGVFISPWLLFVVSVVVVVFMVAAPAVSSTVIVANAPPPPTATTSPVFVFVVATPTPGLTATPVAPPAQIQAEQQGCKPVLFGNLFCTD